jgi:mitogen-activated protein kinase organizer 1
VLFSGSYDRSVRVWDLRSNSRSEIQIIRDFKDSVSSIDVGNDKKTIICGSIDGCVRTYDLRQGKQFVDHIARKFLHS